MAALFKPAAKKLDIEVRGDSMNGIADVRLQVDAGNVTWNLVNPGGTECVQGAREGLFETLDLEMIRAGGNIDGIDPKLVTEHWIADNYYSLVLAWNKQKYSGNPPRSWADFWNTERFPGKRAVYWKPAYVLEAALLADGVSPSALYPLDVDRAFHKMDQLRDSITTFWKSGGQTIQLMKDQEVDMIMMWNGRAATAVEEQLGVEYTFNQAILDHGCWAMPRGAKDKALTMKVLREVLSPEIMANLPLHIPYGPTNTDAFETGKISNDLMAILPSSPENLGKHVLIDSEYWLKHREKIQQRWDAWRTE